MLTLQYIPFNEIENLSSDKRINKLLSAVKKNNVVLMQGKLKSEEEAALIQRTMEEVNKEFRGIELCTVFPKKTKNKDNVSGQIKDILRRYLMADRDGMTIIGPANVIKEIKRNPDKIELLTHNLSTTKKRIGKK
ncbi:MAG: DUF2073 domain-containing protein [Nanoarchaeota archaeon]|nr:DUF2073 domain-containing protein [Nanoarchaeota archaeon]